MYKSIVLAISAIAGLAYAQIPTCAQSCVTIPAECGNGDPSCICNNAQWIANVSCCVATNCDAANQQAALTYAQQICLPVGATLPSSASCANSTSAGTGSVTATRTGTATVGSTRSTITSAASGTARNSGSGGTATATGPSIASSSALAAQIAMPGILGAIVGAAVLL